MPARVSTATRSTAPVSPRGDYTIQAGDTLSQLALRFGTTVKVLMKLNPHLEHADVIREGGVLALPGKRAAGGPAARAGDDGYSRPARPPTALTSPRPPAATGLDAVRAGEVVLSNGAKGPAVREAQELLQKNGHPLKRFGADGDFGAETEAAVRRFQAANGLTQSGALDAPTLSRFELGAAQKTKYPEYDQLFADGVLRQTLAVGYDEGGAHKAEIRKLVDGLTAQGYQPLDVSALSDAELEKTLGVDPKSIDREGTYFVKRFQHGETEVTAVTSLITPDTPNAKQKFADAMAHDEVVMYTGHGRYGSGPDFDDIHSTKGNYRIGDPFERGHVTLGENDLRKTTFDRRYQLMFFDGCNTKHYLDDLRTKARGKDTSNLDVIGANTELPWDTSAADLLAVTGGLSDGASLDDIRRRLNGNYGDGRNKFVFDGFQDNAVEAHPR